jgi:hypothetical protein
MNKLWKIVGIATLVAVLGAATVGAVAYAQDEGSEGPFAFGTRFREAVAGILGINVDEYDAAVEQAREQVVDEALEEGWLTEDQAERMRERMEQGFGPRGMDKGFMVPRGGFMGRGGDSLFAVAAEQLDLSVEDLHAELQDGKTIADLAQERGVNPQDIVDTYLAQLGETLNQAVEDGKLTQKQADWMLEQATEAAPDRLENACEGRFPGGMRGGGRPGGMRGFPGQDDA